MKIISAVWQNSAFLFTPVQKIFNAAFWKVFEMKFGCWAKGNVVDLACGTGDLREFIKPQEYLGVDVNVAYLRYAKRRFKGLPKTSFRQGDVTKFIAEEGYDTAFLISAAHHLSDSQLKKLCKNLKKSNIRKFVVVDGVPQGMPARVLAWLDAKLAGGEYFRTEKELAIILSEYLKIESIGRFTVKNSFHAYPYVITSL